MANLHSVAALLGCCIFSAALSAQPCPITVSAGPDKYLCSPENSTQLEGEIDGTFLTFNWTPTTGLSGANTLTPTATVSTSMTYVLTARAVNLASNLIENGDFEQGNTGFYSDYLYNPGDLVPEGVYNVMDNPQDDHPGFQPCNDHTTGSGNMMVVNGSGTPNQNVWCQTISGLLPNAQYAFSCWVATVVAASPARLQFEINGTTIGPIFTAPGSTCVWQNFYALWTNGAGATATICILNQNTTLGGNDFALDDMVFAPVCEVKDTVKVNVVSIVAKAVPSFLTIPCEGANITLSGAGSSTGANITYLWETATGNIVSGSTTLSPVINAAGIYTLTVTYEKDGFVCFKTATVNVSETTNPFIAWITPPASFGCGNPTLTLNGNSNQPGITAWLWEASSGGHIVKDSTARNCVIDKPGIYTLTATNTVTGCTSTAEVEVVAATNPPIANATSTGIVTCANPTVPLSGMGSSTGTGISYLWSTANGNISGSPTAQNTTAGAGGTYILAVTNAANGCIARDTVTVAANIVAPSVSIAAPQVLDCDTDTLTLSAIFTPQNTVLHWTTVDGNIASGDSTASPRVTLAGTYTLIGINPANGCADTASVTATSNYTPPVAIVHPADSITCQTSSVTLSGSGSSVGIPFLYQWAAGPGGNIVSGGNTLAPVVNAPATYTLVVTDTLNACTATATVSVVADQNIVLAVASAPDTLTCLVKTVALNSDGSSALPSITYLWTTVDGQISGPVNGPGATAALPGTYQLRITNTANGCSATDLAIVAIDTAAPKIQIAPTDILTCTFPERTIQASNLSLPGIFDYVWHTDTSGNIIDGINTLSPTVNSPGIYTLNVKNLETGCTATYATAVGIANEVPLINIAHAQSLTCANPTRQLSASISPLGGNIAYVWTALNGGNITQGDTTPTPTVNQPGTYTLLIINTGNGCTATSSTFVLQNKTAPPAEAGLGTTLTCTAPTFTLSGNTGQIGAYTYAWTSPDGHFIGNPNSAQTTCDSAGLYRLLVTDPANGCTATDSVQVLANQVIPSLQVTPADTLTCSVTQVSFSASIVPAGVYNTQWATLNGRFTAGQNTLMPSVDAPGLYSLLVTNPQNGCTATASLSVAQDTAAPKISVPPVGPITCAFPTRSITAQNISPAGNFQYAWTATSGGNITSATNGLSISINTGGTYHLLATNPANSCTAAQSVIVLENKTAPPAEAGLGATLTCTAPTFALSGNTGQIGAYTYLWTTPDGRLVGSPNSPQVDCDKAGLYRLLVTDPANGCTATDSVQVLSNQVIPALQITPADTLTCYVPEVSFSVGIVPAGFHTTQWITLDGHFTGGQNTQMPSVDKPGFYSLLVTNAANGCTATASLTVVQDTAAPKISVMPVGPITCAFPTRSITAQNVSPAGNFQYAWAASAGGNITSATNGLSITVNMGGTYTLLATNLRNGCTATAAVTVAQNTQLPTAAAGLDDTLSCNIKTLTLSGTASTEPNLNILWTASNGGNILSGANTLKPVIDKPGTYTLLITNPLNGCTASDIVLIFNDVNTPQANAGKADTLTCVRTSTNLAATASVGPTFSYLWTTTGTGNIVSGQTGLTPLVDNPGIYTLAVTNSANGCVTTSTVTVPENVKQPVVDAGAGVKLTCATTSLSLAGTAMGGAATYAWAASNGGNIVSGNTTPTPSIDRTGTYTLTAMLLANGCTASDFVQVGIDTLAPAFNISPPLLLTCVQKTTPLVGLVQQPAAGGFTATWTTVGGNIVSGQNTLAASADKLGTYILTIKNTANGCTHSKQVVVLQNIVPPVAVAEPTALLTCAQPTATLDGTGSSAGNPFSYNWTASPGGQILGGNGTLMPSVGKAGTYTLQVSNADNGCTATASTTVTTNTVLPIAFIVQPLPLTCVRDSTELDATSSTQGAGFSYQWAASGGGHFFSQQNPLIPLADKPGNYALTVTDAANGCTATATATVLQNIQKPGAEAGPGFELHCNLLETKLEGSSPTGAGMAYFWSVPAGSTGNIFIGGLTQTPLVDAPGTYLLQVTDPKNGCTSTDLTAVTESLPPSFSPTVWKPTCLDPTGAVDFGPVTGGKAPFRYSVDGGQTYRNSPAFDNLKIGTYFLQVRDAYGCLADVTVDLQVPFEPTVTLPVSTLIELGDSVLLVPVLNQSFADIVSWQWSPGEWLDCANCPTPEAKPQRWTVYTLKIVDKNGCTATAKTEIRVSRRRQIYAPNVFSPNGDGFNDRFMLFGKGAVQVRELGVYDRWGNALYFDKGLPLNDQTRGWDGTFRGQPMNPAVFVWRAVVEFVDGEVETYFGDVTVER